MIRISYARLVAEICSNRAKNPQIWFLFLFDRSNELPSSYYKAFLFCRSFSIQRQSSSKAGNFDREDIALSDPLLKNRLVVYSVTARAVAREETGTCKRGEKGGRSHSA